MTQSNVTAESRRSCAIIQMRQKQAEFYDAEAHIFMPDADIELSTDETEISLECDPVQCNVCSQQVRPDALVFGIGTCLVSGSCERSFAQMHTELYADAAGDPKVPELPCANCDTVICFATPTDGLGLDISIVGSCLVDNNNAVFQSTGARIFDSMSPSRPDDGIEQFDGEPN